MAEQAVKTMSDNWDNDFDICEINIDGDLINVSFKNQVGDTLFEGESKNSVVEPSD